MSRAVLSRIAKLEARKSAREPKSWWRPEICMHGMKEDPNNPGHLVPDYPVDDWPAMARKQQAELIAFLRSFAEDEPKTAPGIVGNEQLAPLPAGTKRRRFFEYAGAEIDAMRGTEK